MSCDHPVAVSRAELRRCLVFRKGLESSCYVASYMGTSIFCLVPHFYTIV
jgi:hypothetical protein